MLDVLEQKQWGELEAFLVKHETDNDVQNVLVDGSKWLILQSSLLI